MATAEPPVPAVNNYQSLLIVAKGKMNNGLCYMGYNKNTDKLVRPLYSAEEKCWPRGKPTFDFKLGETIQFICSAPDPGKSLFPHKDVDVLVDSIKQRNPNDRSSPTSMFDTLSKLGISTVGNIFGSKNILEDKYVMSGTACRSVGIYSCKGENVELYVNYSKRRCIIKEPLKTLPYDLPITAEDSFVYKQPKHDDSVLLLLGLGRPWLKGDEKEKKCYILVIGMITKPSDLVDQVTAKFQSTHIK